MRRLSSTLLVFLSLAFAACDSEPFGLPDEESAVVALLGGSHDPLSLEGLARQALRQVYALQGASAARELIRSVAPDGDAVLLDAAALRETSAALVLRTFGVAAAEQVEDAVAIERAALAAGAASPAVAAALAEADAHLDAAAAAAARGDARTRLLRATQAYDAVVRARAARLTAGLPGLETLVATALDQRAGDAAVLATYRRAEAAAAAALVGSDAVVAERRQREFRAVQLDLVATSLGAVPVATMLDAADARLEADRESLEHLPDSAAKIRAERAAAAAEDLLHRARRHLERDEVADALDLGSHAVGLLRNVAGFLN